MYGVPGGGPQGAVVELIQELDRVDALTGDSHRTRQRRHLLAKENRAADD